MMFEQFFESLGTKSAHFSEQELALHERCFGVIQHGPDGDQVIELATSLFDDTVQTAENDGHAR